MMTRDVLIEEGQRFRATFESKRSDTLLRLFDFIFDQSVEGKQPKESEIAFAVWGDVQSSIVSQGANIRVYILRLRRKLDEYYAGRKGPRLIIPRGEYRIVLESPVAGRAAANENPTTAGWMGSRLNSRLVLVISTIAVANIAVAGFAWNSHQKVQSVLARSGIWEPLAGQAGITKIVVGDYFLFGKRQKPGLPTEIIRDMSIGSRDDYHIYVQQSAAEVNGLVDLNLHFISSNAVYALRSLWSSFREVNGEQRSDPEVMPASQVDPEVLKSFNLIYVGPLDGIDRLIRNPLFQMSGFKIGSTYNELIDKASGRRFLADGAIPTSGQVPRKEYGYIALIPGPAGKHILIISGTGDAATAQMADLAGDKAKLSELSRRLGGGQDAFEALYQVRTMYSQNYSSDLLIARPVNSLGAWDKSTASQTFPNEIDISKD